MGLNVGDICVQRNEKNYTESFYYIEIILWNAEA